MTAANIFDFEALFKNDISINFGPVLVPEDMIANHEQCNFFLLALNAMCSVDETDLLESEPEETTSLAISQVCPRAQAYLSVSSGYSEDCSNDRLSGGSFHTRDPK